jgi:uncharacterized membrane protein
MELARWLRHLSATHWRTRLLFPKATLDAIEAAVARAERTHTGQIRFAIETALAPRALRSGLSTRARALEVFANLGVWDTEHNNGVLIYVLLADRSVEIVADRGIAARVAPSEWQSVCALMESRYRAGRFEEGSVAGVDAAASLLARHFGAAPGLEGPGNELPDRPALL